MEKYIDMTICGTKADINKVLKESGLKKRLLKGDFSDGIVSVTIKEILPFCRICRNYSLGISSENIESASKVYNSILNKKDEMIEKGKAFYFNSHLCVENTK